MKFVSILIGFTLLLGCDPQQKEENNKKPVENTVSSNNNRYVSFEQKRERRQVWQKLFDDYYATEGKVKEILVPIVVNQTEIKTLSKYLPMVYHQGYSGWWIANFVRRHNKVDPYFPVLPTKIRRIEKQTQDSAILVVQVLCAQKKSNQQVIRFYRVHLNKVNEQWLIDAEEYINERHAGVVTLDPRTPIGHIQLFETGNLNPPEINTSSPQKVLESLQDIIRYTQNIKNKEFVNVIPKIVDMFKPYVTEKYFAELESRKTVSPRIFRIKNPELKQIERPEKFAEVSNATYYHYTFNTTKNDEDFRPYEYYLAFIVENNKHLIASEVGERLNHLPPPEPLPDNFMILNWEK